MARISADLLIALLSIMAVSVFTAAGVGSWQPINDLNSPRVAEVANFALEEYHKGKDVSFAAVHVVKGEMQVVAGTNYRLLISADNGGAQESYTAVVYAPLGNKPMQLISCDKN